MLGPADDGEDGVMAAINTTPLVDVMLVLLIIFLMTIPVLTQTVPVQLPKETNQPRLTKPENVNIAVNKNGDIFWGEQLVPDIATLLGKLKKTAALNPRPEVHIRGDGDARYEAVGKVLAACRRAGIAKISFITEPPPRG